MHLQIFQDTRSGAAHDLFEKWRIQFPAGYFLNRHTRVRFTLHASTCGHLDASIATRATKGQKVCAESEAELREWASREGCELTVCVDCGR